MSWKDRTCKILRKTKDNVWKARSINYRPFAYPRLMKLEDYMKPSMKWKRPQQLKEKILIVLLKLWERELKTWNKMGSKKWNCWKWKWLNCISRTSKVCKNTMKLKLDCFFLKLRSWKKKKLLIEPKFISFCKKMTAST